MTAVVKLTSATYLQIRVLVSRGRLAVPAQQLERAALHVIRQVRPRANGCLHASRLRGRTVPKLGACRAVMVYRAGDVVAALVLGGVDIAAGQAWSLASDRMSSGESLVPRSTGGRTSPGWDHSRHTLQVLRARQASSNAILTPMQPHPSRGGT
jgi:hypothetical protein